MKFFKNFARTAKAGLTALAIVVTAVVGMATESMAAVFTIDDLLSTPASVSAVTTGVSVEHIDVGPVAGVASPPFGGSRHLGIRRDTLTGLSSSTIGSGFISFAHSGTASGAGWVSYEVSDDVDITSVSLRISRDLGAGGTGTLEIYDRLFSDPTKALLATINVAAGTADYVVPLSTLFEVGDAFTAVALSDMAIDMELSFLVATVPTREVLAPMTGILFAGSLAGLGLLRRRVSNDNTVPQALAA